MNREEVSARYNALQDAISAYVDAEKEMSKDFTETSMVSAELYQALQGDYYAVCEQLKEAKRALEVGSKRLTVNVAGEEWTREYEEELERNK